MTLRFGSTKEDRSGINSVFSRPRTGDRLVLSSPLLPAFTSVLYSFFISYGVLYCAATSQQIPFSDKRLLWGCVLISAVCSVVFSFKRRLPAFLGAGAAALLTGWLCRGDILAAARTALYHSSGIYRSYLFFIPEYIPAEGTAADEASAFLLCIAAVLALLTARTVCRPAPPWLPLGSGAAVLAAGMIVYAAEPSVPHFLMLISAMTLLVLTHSVRRHSPADGAALTLRLMLPAVALVLLLTAIVSPEDYTRPKAADTVSDAIISVYDKLLPDYTDPDEGETWDSFAAETISEEVDMSEIGPKGKSGRWVMSLCSNAGGIIYLRGMSYADYTDNKWHILPEEEAAGIEQSIIYSPFDPDCTYDGTVQIQSSRIYPVIFMPYYPMTLYASDNAENMLPHETYGDSYISNPGDISVYTVDYGTPEHGLALCSGVVNQFMYEDFIMTRYLQIPPETEADLYNIAVDAGLTDLPQEQLPYAVAEYVRGSAEYSLDTPKAPDGADFPVWFLTESDTGYCMHYATATALMLRALGIPARYVTGYAVTTVAGEWYNVLEDCAHAWVEFYDPVLGWSVLDATPGDALEGEDETESESTTATSEGTEDPTAATTTPPEPQNAQDSASASDAQTPSATDDPNAPQQPSQGKRGISVLWLLPLLLVPLALVTTRRMILRRRQRSYAEGGANSRALAMWEQICRLCAASGTKPEKAAEELALKARFSQHELTDDELTVISAHMEQLTASLRESSRLFRSLKNKYFKFLY